MIVGIVLAGGRASRFGRDKLAEPVGGEPLLWRPIRALAAAGCGDVVVVIAPAIQEPAVPVDLQTQAGVEPGSPMVVRFARDPVPFGGPLVGLRAGLAAIVSAGIATPAPSGAVVALVVGGDQPNLQSAVLGSLGDRVTAGARAAILADADSHARPLPMALDVADGLEVADRLLAAGRLRLRDLLDDLGADVIGWEAWARLDPAGRSLADIDEPKDLVDPDPG